MFCSKCGKKIEDDTKFCLYCGSQIAGSHVGNIESTVKKASDTAMNTAKSVGNVVKESVEKIDGEVVKDTIKKATDTAVNFAQPAQNTANKATSGKVENNNQNRKNTIVGIIVICLVVFLLFKGCGVLFGGSKGEKLAKNLVAATYADCKVKSATKVVGNDESHWYVYQVRFDSPKDGEFSAVVVVNTEDSMVFIEKGGVFSKKRYDELNAMIETEKLIFGSK